MEKKMNLIALITTVSILFCLASTQRAPRHGGGGRGGGRGGGGGRDGFGRGGPPDRGGGRGRGDGGRGGGGGGGGRGRRDDGLNRDERRIVNQLFRSRRQQNRVVTALPDGTGYVASTTSNNAEVVRMLQLHSEQMAALIRQGRRTRQFDPSMAQFHEVQANVVTQTQNTQNGVRVTVRGSTPLAAATVCNHANGVSLFVRNGRREEDRTHPRVQPPYQCRINN